MDWEIRNFRKMLQDSSSNLRLLQEVSLEFEAGRSVHELLKQTLDSLSYLYLQIHVIVILFAYATVTVELLKPKVNCPSKWSIALEKSHPDSLKLVLKHIQGRSWTRTFAVDVNVSFGKVDGSAPALSRSEI
jgi:hypothetical protein